MFTAADGCFSAIFCTHFYGKCYVAAAWTNPSPWSIFQHFGSSAPRVAHASTPGPKFVEKESVFEFAFQNHTSML